MTNIPYFESPFKHIGIIGNYRQEHTIETVLALKAWLQARSTPVIMDAETAAALPPDTLPTLPRHELGKQCDLIIVVGGDGSLLHAAHSLVAHNTPVIGINRGRLGFLTDIRPDELATKLAAVLNGEYHEEQRFLLEAQILDADGTLMAQDYALNEVVLAPGDVTHMVEFEIYINHQFVCSQRADGLITATPTGSTAYAMSGGGPILHPGLNALLLLPMFPHTLTSRPIVIDANSEIQIVVSSRSKISPRISCDGREHIPVAPSDRILIRKKTERLKLIHPLDYDYFETLRTKLHWGTRL
jgi:NAD+ kinase